MHWGLCWTLIWETTTRRSEFRGSVPRKLQYPNSRSVPMTLHIPCKEGMRGVQGILAGLRALSKFYMVDTGSEYTYKVHVTLQEVGLVQGN